MRTRPPSFRHLPMIIFFFRIAEGNYWYSSNTAMEAQHNVRQDASLGKRSHDREKRVRKTEQQRCSGPCRAPPAIATVSEPASVTIRLHDISLSEIKGHQNYNLFLQSICYWNGRANPFQRQK